jgi:hypothetical protein
MERGKSVEFDDFPFTFYNKKNGAVMYDYNQVKILEHNGVHNIGIYRRLCACFNQVPNGIQFFLIVHSRCLDPRDDA